MSKRDDKNTQALLFTTKRSLERLANERLVCGTLG